MAPSHITVHQLRFERLTGLCKSGSSGGAWSLNAPMRRFKRAARSYRSGLPANQARNSVNGRVFSTSAVSNHPRRACPTA